MHGCCGGEGTKDDGQERRKTSGRLAGLGISEAAYTQGLELGNLSYVHDMTCYAKGVEEKGEKVSNRKWDDHSPEVKALARKLAKAAGEEIAGLF